MHQSYKVLARTYRPQTFSQIVGQEIPVRILQNALKRNKLSHAIVLTGIRGIGKTTSARLLAKTLCCHAPVELIDPCGECPSCQSFQLNRHTDIIEMDAASHTGVDDMRDLMEGISYKPHQGNYRVYIIDEVHMLSKSAFNALLKTLEEPPEHVIFIFATTELDKVPETILSRCLQISLQPVEDKIIAQHLTSICDKEGIAYEPAAIQLLAENVGGSVRDALSLLEKVIAYHRSEDQINLELSSVEFTLGKANSNDLAQVLSLCLTSQIEAALEEMHNLYAKNITPAGFIKDFMALVHTATCAKIRPSYLEAKAYPQKTIECLKPFIETLSIPLWNRLWMVIEKSYQEIQRSPLAKESIDMMLIRLSHAAMLPTLEEVVSSSQSTGIAGGGAPINSVQTRPSSLSQQASIRTAVMSSPSQQTTHMVNSLDDILELLHHRKEPELAYLLKRDLIIHSFKKGRIEFSVSKAVKDDIQSSINSLHHLLKEETGIAWSIEKIVPSEDLSVTTYHQQKVAEENERKEKAINHDLIQYITTKFPNIQSISATKANHLDA